MGSSTQALVVANTLITLADREFDRDDAVRLTHLMVQKLLYFVQGWSLVDLGKPLFPETIEAWKLGPVVPAVYAQLKHHGREPIIPAGNTETTLATDDLELIVAVWDRYKGYSASGLITLTHAETPWMRSYLETERTGVTQVITLDSIRDEFQRKVIESEERLAAQNDRVRALARANTLRLTGREAV